MAVLPVYEKVAGGCGWAPPPSAHLTGLSCTSGPGKTQHFFLNSEIFFFKNLFFPYAILVSYSLTAFC